MAQDIVVVLFLSDLGRE